MEPSDHRIERHEARHDEWECVRACGGGGRGGVIENGAIERESEGERERENVRDDRTGLGDKV